MVNILDGGDHTDNKHKFQEFMITPAGALNFFEAMMISSNVFYSLKNILEKEDKITSVGLEGGFAPDLKSNREAIDLIIKAIYEAGYTSDDVKICLDIASSEFYEDEKYKLKGEKLELDRKGMCEYLSELTEDYPVISIEDGMAQDDYTGWRILTDGLKDKCLIVGDDLVTTNPKLLK